MIWLRGCPKCRGELADEKDAFGYYIYCLQCGYQLSEVQIGKLWTFTLNRRARQSASRPVEQQPAALVRP
ncbi:MAG: hypothetical protein HY680_03395 [Chloroflexi bacterium]|nr:hypothetical protein [Chloroflexota bacterium]